MVGLPPPSSSDPQTRTARKGRPPVKVDVGAVRALFNVPQPVAAKSLGISLTALKQLCRKLGVARWPYQRGSFAKSVRSDSLITTFVPDPVGLTRSCSMMSTASTVSMDPGDASQIADAASDAKYNSGARIPQVSTVPYGCSAFAVPYACSNAFASSSSDTIVGVGRTMASVSEIEEDEDIASDLDMMLPLDGEFANQYAREALWTLC
jgi:hypothetical protein